MRSPSVKQPTPIRQQPLALVAILLFGSGFCALTYQVVWFREFRLVFGASTAASAAVLAVFMGGIGLGSALLGRKVDTQRRPLRLYGWLELGIGLAAGLSPVLISIAQSAYHATGGQSVLGLPGATVARLALSCAVLGLPTFLMGGTLPAAVRAATRDDDCFRYATALLYGINTLGAVVGAALSTFLLLPAMSTHAVLWLACGLNLVIGLVAILVVPRERAPTVIEETGQSGKAAFKPRRGASSPTGISIDAPSPERVGFVYTAAGVVGFAFFLMELVWYRMLGPILGGSTYTFGLILVVALLGIGLGGAFYSVVLRRVQPSFSTFGLSCALESLFIAAPYAMGDRLALLAYDLRQGAETFSGEVLGWFLVASIVVIPAAAVAGAQFPLLIALAGRGRENIGRHVGTTYAWNTVGAIIGSLAGGFGLLPLLTAPGAWAAVVVLLASLCLAALVYSAGKQFGWQLIPASVATLAAIGLIIFSEGPTAVWRHSGIGAGRATIDRSSYNATRAWMHDVRRAVLWEADGIEASVAVRADNGLTFFINGKADGNAVADAGTQIMLGVLPALLHPKPKTAMVVGMGTGETAGWLAEIPTVERVDVVELERAIDEVARRCAPVNHDVLRHPRVQRIYNDAREVLLTTPEHYDIISSEPSNPYRAGIASLFTREFYCAVRDRLNQGGLFVQWLQGYEVDDQTVRTVCATLSSVFVHVEIWQSRQDDMLLVCSQRRLGYTEDTLGAKLREKAFRQALSAGWHATDLEAVVSRFVANASFVKGYAAAKVGYENTDARNRIEYTFATNLGRETGFSIARLRSQASETGDDRPARNMGEMDWSKIEAYRQVIEALGTGRVAEARDPTDVQAARSEVLRRYWMRDTAGMVQAWEAAGYEPLFPMETIFLGLAYADNGNDRAREFADRLMNTTPLDAHGILAFCDFRQGQIESAIRHLEICFRGLRDNPWLMSHVGELLLPMAAQIGATNAEASARLWPFLREPFAVYAFEPLRQDCLVSIAPAAGLDLAVRLCQQLEPNVPWNEGFLAFRARVYQVADHPHLRRATDDLRAFSAATVRSRPG